MLNSIQQAYLDAKPKCFHSEVGANNSARVGVIFTLSILLGCSLPCYGQVTSISLTIKNLGGSTFSIQGIGAPGQPHQILSSESLLLTNWKTLGTVTGDLTGTFTLTDSTNLPQRFYRSLSSGLTNPGLGFSPTNISGLTYYWDYHDLAQTNQITNWPDRVDGLVLKKSETIAPTNTNVGVYFQSAGLTNATLNVSSNASFWIVVRPVTHPSGRCEMFANSSSLSGFYLSNGVFDGFWSGDHLSGSQLPLRESVNLVYARGTVYTNGVSAEPVMGVPSGILSLQRVGYGFNGYVQYVGIWTNYGLTAADAQQLYTWSSTNGVTNVTSGLYAYWKLDEGGGTFVGDASGNNRNGVFTNSPSWTNGFIGGGLRFHGVQSGPDPQEAIVMSNATDNFTNFSVAFWVRELDWTPHGLIVSKLRDTDSNFGWMIMTETSQLRYGEWDVDNWIETPDTNPDAFINDGKWHHFVSVRTSSTNAVTYKDGAQIPGNLVVVDGGATNINNSLNIKLGFNTPFYGSTPNVVLDEVRIYNRALSEAEIEILYRWRGQP